MSTRKTLAQIRKLLASREWDAVDQGCELAAALDDPEVAGVLGRGIEYGEDDAISWSRDSEIAKRVKPAHRERAAFRLLWATGGLATRESLELKHDQLWCLEGLTSLRSLKIEIAYREALDDLSAVSGLTGLRELNVKGACTVRDLSALAGLRALETLRLGHSVRELTDISALAGLPRLTKLSLDAMRALDPAQLGALTGLRYLGLYRVRVTDLAPIAALTELTELYLMADLPDDLSPLAQMRSLETLSFGYSRLLSDVSAVVGLTGLRKLSLNGTRVTDLTPLAGLTGLEVLSLNNCKQLIDLAPLAGLTALRELGLEWSPITDMSALRSLQSLRKLKLDRAEILGDMASLRSLSGLADGVELDEQGEPTRDGEPIRGEALQLLVAVAPGLPPDHPLRAATTLQLSGAAKARAFSGLSAFGALRSLWLNVCLRLESIEPILALPDLDRLAVKRCDALRPRPRRVLIEGPAAIGAYKQLVARALARQTDRTPEQDALLERSRAEGLVEPAP